VNKSLLETQRALAILGLVGSIAVDLRTFTKVNIGAPELAWAVPGLLLLFLVAVAPLVRLWKTKRNQQNRRALRSYSVLTRGILAALLLYSIGTWYSMLQITGGELARRNNGKPVLTLRYGYKVGSMS
jgi:hypothetical protein